MIDKMTLIIGQAVRMDNHVLALKFLDGGRGERITSGSYYSPAAATDGTLVSLDDFATDDEP